MTRLAERLEEEGVAAAPNDGILAGMKRLLRNAACSRALLLVLAAKVGDCSLCDVCRKPRVRDGTPAAEVMLGLCEARNHG